MDREIKQLEREYIFLLDKIRNSEHTNEDQRRLFYLGNKLTKMRGY